MFTLKNKKRSNPPFNPHTTSLKGVSYLIFTVFFLQILSLFKIQSEPIINSTELFQTIQVDLDILGNRKTVTVKDGNSVVLAEEKYNQQAGTYTSDPTNKINSVGSLPTSNLSLLTYDANGNITDDGKNTYLFDCENKLLSITDKATGNPIANYYYDAEGRRIKKEITPFGASSCGLTTGSSIYIYNGDQVVEERNASGALLQWTIHGLSIDDVNRITLNGIKYYPLTNDQGSVLAVTDSSGNVLQRYDYTPFGNITVQNANGDALSGVEGSPLINTLFQGRELDLESGLYFYRSRYYSPELGRFISHDPMDYVDGMNMYEAMRGNLLRYSDPMGTVRTDVDSRQRFNITEGGGGGFGGGSGGIAADIPSITVAVQGFLLWAGQKIFGPKEEPSHVIDKNDVKEGIARELKKDDNKPLNAVGQQIEKQKTDEARATTNKQDNTSGTEVANKQIEEVKNKTEKKTNRSEKSIEEKRLTKAKNFYEKSGYDEANANKHIEGIDKSKPVSTQTIRAGQRLVQYQYPEGKQGNYYANLEADPNKMGIDAEGKIKNIYEATRDVKTLKSTAADMPDWNGSTRVFKGGETQYFTAEKDAFKLIEEIKG